MASKPPAARGAATARRAPPDEPAGDDGTELWLSTSRSAAHYRMAAARARMLQAATTTPRLKRYLGEIIARCEGRAGDIDGSAEP